MNKSRLAVYAGGESLGMSVQNLVHWSQSMMNGTFSHMDHGSFEENMKRYGSGIPPPYMIENITCKDIALFSSPADLFGPPEDVQRLRNRLRVPLMDDYIVPFKKWSHLDFMWGMDAGKYVNQRALDILARYQGDQ